jgi:hypothetical protein
MLVSSAAVASVTLPPSAQPSIETVAVPHGDSGPLEIGSGRVAGLMLSSFHCQTGSRWSSSQLNISGEIENGTGSELSSLELFVDLTRGSEDLVTVRFDPVKNYGPKMRPHDWVGFGQSWNDLAARFDRCRVKVAKMVTRPAEARYPEDKPIEVRMKAKSAALDVRFAVRKSGVKHQLLMTNVGTAPIARLSGTVVSLRNGEAIGKDSVTFLYDWHAPLTPKRPRLHWCEEGKADAETLRIDDLELTTVGQK